MASASILHSEDQFLCSICLGVLTDPISIPCGHNYCETCITQLWDVTDVCKCPQCNKTFHRRPEVFVNKVLSELADQFKKSSVKQEAAKADEVSCDVCTETKLKAVKSCLVCLTSYCETHLEPHSRRLKRHKLIEPVKNLEDLLCQKHDRPLELFCKMDDTCVCNFCTESDHKSHHVVSLEEEWKGKKAELGKKEAKVQQMVQERQVKIQEVKHSVELSKKDADREIADSVQVFTALISCIQKSQAEVIDVIEEKQKTTEKQAEGFIKDLQQEITQLEKRSSELKQLSHTEDHLHLLQNFASINTPPPTKDWTKVNVNQSPHVGTLRTALAQLEKTLSQEFEKKLRGVEQLREIKEYAAPYIKKGSVAAQPTVKIQTIVRGQSYDSRTLLQRVKQVGGLHVEETTSGKVVVLFCPVVAGYWPWPSMVKIETAMNEVPEEAETVILVLMYSTCDTNYSDIITSLSGDLSGKVTDFVHVLYHDSVHGLLTCSLNDKAVAQLHAALLKHSTVTPVDALVYSAGSTAHGYSGGNTAGMYSGGNTAYVYSGGSPGHGYGASSTGHGYGGSSTVKTRGGGGFFTGMFGGNRS